MTAPRCLLLLIVLAAPLRADTAKPTFLLKEGDRVAWVGSSSTAIGVWPRTMEFLFNTRHPDQKLSFKRFTTGGGTFATGLMNLDKWLDDYKPTVVVFNYGGNDVNAGEAGLPKFKETIEKCVAAVTAKGARVVFVTPQAADVRKSTEAKAAMRTRYAEELLSFGKEKGWPVIDTHHPLDALQKNRQKDDDAYTILKDTIHLTDPAYIGWGYFMYEGMNPPAADSSLTLTAKGDVTAAVRCQAEDVKAENGALRFVRADAVLPLLPPVALPPRKHVPLERFSAYRLAVTGLPEGRYDITCEGQPLGSASAKELDAGVNLNTLLLDSGKAAPWEKLTKELWAGKELDQVGKTRWSFEVKPSDK